MKYRDDKQVAEVLKEARKVVVLALEEGCAEIPLAIAIAGLKAELDFLEECAEE